MAVGAARSLQAAGIPDLLALEALDPTGRALVPSPPISIVRRPSRVDAAKWSHLGEHVAAAARLRRAVASEAGSEAADDDGETAGPAVAEHPAPSRTARDRLRATAKQTDRARASARTTDDDEVLGFWKGLVAGRWSLVDSFESEGRRYLVARKNEPDVRDPRGLSLREREVLALAAIGQPLKVIAYSLGLSLGTVAHHRAQGMRKLGLRSTTELVRLFTAVSAVKAQDPPELCEPVDSSSELVG